MAIRGDMKEKDITLDKFNEYLATLDPKTIHLKRIHNCQLEVKKLESEGDHEAAGQTLWALMDYFRENFKFFYLTFPEESVVTVDEFPEGSDQDVLIKSRSWDEEREDYVVRLSSRSCSCDWISKASLEDFAKNDVRRICRHQVEAAESLGGVVGSDEALAVLNSPYRNMHYKALFTPDLSFVIGYDDDVEWINVIAVKPTLKQTDYSYHLFEDRWSYGESPKGHALNIKGQIRRAFNFK